MNQEMDVVSSLKKISRELDEAAFNFINGSGSKDELISMINGAAWLISYIADGLEHELGLAQQRGNALRYKELGPLNDYT